MKKHTKAKKTSLVKRFPRLLLAGILLTMAFLTIGVVAGISKQRFKAQESNKQGGSTTVANAAKTHMTTGQQVEGQTAQIKPLTPEEAQKLAAALKELANRSTAGLKQVQHPAGTASTDLEG